MDFKDLWGIPKKFKNHPIKTSILILIIFFLVIVGFYIQGYVNEKGRQSAVTPQVTSLDTLSKPKPVTIVSDEITLSGSGVYLVDTENKAEKDYINRISGLSVGDKVTIQSTSNDREVIVQASDYLKMSGPVFHLNNKNDKILFTCGEDGVCVEDNRISVDY